MGKIKQGILGGFRGKVGTVIGASWNGIAYMRGIPQSQKDPKTNAQLAHRAFFREVQDLVGQLSYEQLRFLFPNPEKQMSRRNAMVKQLSSEKVIEDGAMHVDLANLGTIGNAPTADLPDVTVTASRSNLTITWDTENAWRSAHANEYPTICIFNVTQRKIFLVHSTVTIGASGEQSFTSEFAAYGIGSDEYAGIMLSTGKKIPLVGFGTLGVVTRPARQGRNPRTGKTNV